MIGSRVKIPDEIRAAAMLTGDGSVTTVLYRGYFLIGKLGSPRFRYDIKTLRLLTPEEVAFRKHTYGVGKGMIYPEFLREQI